MTQYRHLISACLVSVIALLVSGCSDPQTTPVTPPTPATVAAVASTTATTTAAQQPIAATTAIVPVPRQVEYEWMTKATWYRMHADDVEAAQEGKAELVFLGDSITESWGWDGYEEAFAQNFGQYSSVNFGIGGDQTQNLLWRLQNGLKGQLDPKAVVVKIGVNNFNHGKHSPAEIFQGVAAVVEQARSNYPNAKILLHAVLPFGQKASSPNRLKLAELNRQLKPLGDDQRVFVYDFGAIFLDANGDIPTELMGDYLHPSAQGMALFGAQLAPVIAPWLAK